MASAHLQRLLCVAICLCLSSVAAPARAQSGDDEARTLDDVVVVAERATTATKTDTALIETPQAISVVPSELGEERGARNLQETLRYTAGVTAEAFGLDTRSEVVLVRGLDPVHYLDGMRKVYNFNPLPRTEVYGLDRVEVLRGPSSMLYGAGSAGGVVNAISKRPSFRSGGEVGVQYGSFDRKQVQFDVTGALDDAGTLAGRVVGVHRDSGMQTDHVADDREFLAPSLTWRAGDRTDLTFLATWQRDDTASSQQFLPVVATLQASGERRLDPSTFLGDTGYDRLRAEQRTATLLAEHRATDALTLRANARYVDAETTFQEIYPDVYSNPQDPFLPNSDSEVNRFAYGVKPEFGILTSEISAQYVFDTGPLRHTLLAGVDYRRFRQSSQTAFGSVTPIDIYDPVSIGVIAPPYLRDPEFRLSELGVYAQDQIRWGERLSLIVGARRDRANADTQDSVSQNDEETTFRAGLIGEIGAGVSPYVSYTESFLPVAGLDFNDRAFVPQRGRQVEVGAKWVPMRGALLTANVYRIVDSNRPTNDPDNVLNTVQTGEVRSRGIEFEGMYALPDDITLTASWSYNDAEVSRSNFAPEVGVRLSDVPRHLASIWAAKTFVLGADTSLRVGLGGRYVGDTLSTTASGSLRTPSYTLADALVALERGPWSLSVNATNLFDKEYFAPCRAFGDCFTGNTRSVVGTVSYRF